MSSQYVKPIYDDKPAPKKAGFFVPNRTQIRYLAPAMHLNHFLLKQLAAELSPRLTGAILEEAWSQERDEMVLEFRLPAPHHSFYIRAFLRAELTYLGFPATFNRQRSNTFSFFKDSYGAQVLGVQHVPFDRSFYIRLTGGRQIVFKMHGNRANVVLLNEGSVEELFKNSLQADLALTLESLAQTPDLSRQRFDALDGNAYKLLPQIGPEGKDWLEYNGYSTLAMDAKWAQFQHLIAQLQASRYYLTQHSNRTQLLLFEQGAIEQRYTSALEAAQGFARVIGYRFYTEVAKRDALKELTRRHDQTVQNLAKMLHRQHELGDGQGYRQQADVLMANLHQFANATQAQVLNFYTGQQQTIHLKQGVTPQKTAESLYRKSRNAHQEIARLQEQIDSRQALKERLSGALAEVAIMDSVKEIKSVMDALGLRKEKLEAEETLPFRSAVVDGWEIRIGKNALSNDAMLRSYSHKDDLWLHAKDVPGSHVLLIHRSGQNFPKNIIERAAAAAAWHSKKRNEKLADVIVTPRKFVRKQKGAAAGAVRVEKERVLMVEPKDV